jgi:tetratricopeptide (TPR) repeat protein
MQSTKSRRFAVAFSFPGEYRDYVERVARALLPSFGGDEQGKARIFYDAWHEEDIIGYASNRKLQGAYADSDLIVPFYCQNYLNKEWCGIELRVIEEVLFEREYERVLPFRFDMVEIPGSFKTDIFPVVNNREPGEVARLILERYNRIQNAALLVPAPAPAPRIGNLRRVNPMFVGRRTELERLEKIIFSGRIGVVTAVHGLGGLGKTELAVAFADSHINRFAGGVWLLQAEGRSEILPLLADLALDLGLKNEEGARETEAQRGRRVLAELRRRTSAAGADAACLIVLDNVSEQALLSSPQLSEIPFEPWLRIVVTTRLAPQGAPKAALQASFEFVAVDALEEDDALVLVESYQPGGGWPQTSADEDRQAARTLVRELGGFTLAVEAVAVFLGQHLEIRPAEFLARLAKHGLLTLDSLGQDPDVAAQIRHREKQLRIVLDATLATLTPLSQVALKYAALLPPDSIPWPWLQLLVTRERPNDTAQEAGFPDPWLLAGRQLAAHRLLPPTNTLWIGRLHRLVGKHVRDRMTEGETREALNSLDNLLAEAAVVLEGTADHESTYLWTLRPLQEAVLYRDSDRPNRQLAIAADIVGWLETRLGRLDYAEAFLRIAARHRAAIFDANPTEFESARSLSVTLNKTADLLVIRSQPGDAEQALAYYHRGRDILKEIAGNNPASLQAAHDLLLSETRLADLLVARGQPGDAEQAFDYYQAGLAASEQLARNQPDSAVIARELSVSLNKLADFLETRGQVGDADQAFEYYQRSLTIRQQLARDNPDSAQTARDLSVSFTKIADFLIARGQPGDFERAFDHYQRSLTTTERLASSNPDSVQAARDLSLSLAKLADFLAARGQPGDSDQAFGYYQRVLTVREQLMHTNPALAVRDLSTSLTILADFLAVRRQPGDTERALNYYLRSLAMDEQVVRDNSWSSQAAHDLSISLNKLAAFLAARKGPGDLEQALDYNQRSLAIDEQLARDNPQSAQAARDLSVTLTGLAEFLVARGLPDDIERALNYYQRSLTIDKQLAHDNPQSAQAARDLSVTLSNMGDVFTKRRSPGDAEKALGHYKRSLEIREQLARDNPDSVRAASDVMASLERLARATAEQLGDAQAAFQFQMRSVAIARKLYQDNPDSFSSRRAVAVSSFWTAMRAHAAGDEATAVQCVLECSEILDALVAAGYQLDPGLEALSRALQAAAPDGDDK